MLKRCGFVRSALVSGRISRFGVGAFGVDLARFRVTRLQHSLVSGGSCADGGSASRESLNAEAGSLVGVKGGADLVDLGAVDADGFVEDLGGDAELVGPVGHVGGDLGVDLVEVVGSLGVVFVGGVGRGFLGLLFVLYGIMFGHRGASCTD